MDEVPWRDFREFGRVERLDPTMFKRFNHAFERTEKHRCNRLRSVQREGKRPLVTTDIMAFIRRAHGPSNAWGAIEQVLGPSRVLDTKRM